MLDHTKLDRGVFEFVFGLDGREIDRWLNFWAVLGFHPQEEGALDATGADQLYGHASGLKSFRLAHAGCATYGTGMVRLHCWDKLSNDGLAGVRPIATGSRWMGLYTRDILQVRDSFTADRSVNDWNLWVSPLVSAPLEKPAPEVDFDRPFVGLRETLAFGDDFRLAFIQRGGFDRPGFGTFDESLTFKNTEGSHANIVQPADSFDTDFYKKVFGFETAPFGEAHDSGDEAPTIAALDLRESETFRVERTRAVDVPSGLLQVYSSYLAGDDARDRSRAGCRNLCLYSVATQDVSGLAAACIQHGAGTVGAIVRDEFGKESFTFDAPDGYQWLVTGNA